MNEDGNNDKAYSVIGCSPVAFWLTHFLLFIFCLASKCDWLRYGYFQQVNLSVSGAKLEKFAVEIFLPQKKNYCMWQAFCLADTRTLAGTQRNNCLPSISKNQFCVACPSCEITDRQWDLCPRLYSLQYNLTQKTRTFSLPPLARRAVHFVVFCSDDIFSHIFAFWTHIQ